MKIQRRYRIVFAGTPEFALPSLEALIASEHRICAVYSQRDKRRGRGQASTPSVVKALALANNIAVETPDDFKSPLAIAKLASYKPDIIVVVAYGMLLPQAVIDIAKIACLNVHASLLPRWRGAAPINSAILAGDQISGVSIMQLVLKLDAGPVWLQKSCNILASDTAIDLHNKLSNLGATALLDVLNSSMVEQFNPTVQDEKLVTYAGKMTKQDALLCFTKSAAELVRHVRAMQPWPGSCFYLANNNIKVYEAEEVTCPQEFPAGYIISWGRGGLVVATKCNNIRILSLQLPGKRIMSAADAWLGNKDLFQVGHLLIRGKT